MTRLPDHHQPHAPQAGQTTLTATDEQRIDRIADAFNQALEEATKVPTFYKDPSPVPTIGTAPPVAQPGRPPMSKAASDVSGVLIASSLPIFALGAAATGILWGSGQADPTVIAWICGGVVALPAAIALPVLALKGLMKSAKEVVQAAPPTIHQHYNGPIHQDNRQNHLHTDTRGVIAINRNELPPTC